MKNGAVSDKLQMQEREMKNPEISFAGEKKNTADMHKYENVKAQTNINAEALSDIQTQQQIDESDIGSLFSMLPSAADISPNDEPHNHYSPRKRRNQN